MLEWAFFLDNTFIAAGSVGFGGYFNGHWFEGRWVLSHETKQRSGY